MKNNMIKAGPSVKMREQEQLDFYKSIAPVYPGKFPADFVNDVHGWAFTKEEIKQSIGKILTLDIDFDSKCSLDCPHCFRKDSNIDKTNDKKLTFTELLGIIKEAKSLGLKSVKFLGKGEPFDSPKILDFLAELNKLDIIPLIFTKGHVIGDDEKINRKFSSHGITNSKQLVEYLKKLDVSILLGFNSFIPRLQNHMVGDGYKYTIKRNRALELLVEAGFNRSNPTKLCIATNPLTNENYYEIFEIYKWARMRNMYVIVTPTMISGRERLEEDWKRITPSAEHIINLYYKIYKFNIENGIQTLDQIIEEGIAAYAGGHPCNQVAVGMYVTLNGIVLRCPGDDTTILGNLREQSLEEIWVNSENYERSGTFNCGCPPKFGKSIPYNLFTEVILKLKKEFGKTNERNKG